MSVDLQLIVVENIPESIVLGLTFFRKTKLLLDFTRNKVTFNSENRVFCRRTVSIPPFSTAIINAVTPRLVTADQNNILSVVPIDKQSSRDFDKRPKLPYNIKIRDTIAHQIQCPSKNMAYMVVAVENKSPKLLKITKGTPVGILQNIVMKDCEFRSPKFMSKLDNSTQNKKTAVINTVKNNKWNPDQNINLAHEVNNSNIIKEQKQSPKQDSVGETYEKSDIEITKEFDLRPSQINKTDKNRLVNLLTKYNTIFSDPQDISVRPAKFDPVRLPLIQNPPVIYSKAYKMSLFEQEEVERQLRAMVDADVIEPSVSPYNSPIILIRKRSNDYRFCVDLRAINRLVRDDIISVPDNISDTFLHLAKYYDKNSVMSQIDLRASYHQLTVHKDDRQFLAFSAGGRHWASKRVPFGLKCSALFLKRALTQALGPLINHGVFLYIDDVLLVTRDVDSHFVLLEQVFERLRNFEFTLKPAKCLFFVKQLDFVGYTLADGVLKPQTSKIKSVRDAQIPKTKKDLRSFIGLINFNRKWIKNFAETAKPLYDLIKGKSKQIQWNESAQRAFDKLKDDLANSTALYLPRPGGVYHLYTDASGSAVAYSLFQGKTSEPVDLIPLAHGGRVLSPVETRYAISHLEFLAVIASLHHIEHIARSSPIVIHVDHSSIIDFMRNSTKSGFRNARLTRWIIYLSHFPHLEFRYIKGSKMPADFLSRHIFKEGELVEEEYNNAQDASIEKVIDASAIFCTKSQSDSLKHTALVDTLDIDVTALKRIQNKITKQNHILKQQNHKQSPLLPNNIIFSTHQLQQLQDNDTLIKSIKTLIQEPEKCAYMPHIDKATYLLSTDCHIDENGLVRRFSQQRYKGSRNSVFYNQILLPKCLRLNVINNVHLASHCGVQRCLEEIRQTYFWPSMFSDLQNVIRACDVCQRFQAKYTKSRAPLAPNAISKVGLRWAIDIIGPLVPSNGCRYILLCQEVASKWLIATPLRSFDAETCARVVIKKIIFQYGLFNELFSDNGTNFTSNVFRAVLRQLNITQVFAPAYSPSSNGQIERGVRALSNALKRAVHGRPQKWSSVLDSVVFALNCAISSSTNYSAYQLLYGRLPNLAYKPVNVDDVTTDQPANEVYTELVHSLNVISKELELHVSEYKSKMKAEFDKKSKIPKYNMFDRVWVFCVDDDVQSRKFQTRFDGPYFLRDKIDSVIWTISVSLDGPVLNRRVHVNQLAPYYSHTLKPLYQPPDGVHAIPISQLVPADTDRSLPYHSFQPVSQKHTTTQLPNSDSQAAQPLFTNAQNESTGDHIKTQLNDLDIFDEIPSPPLPERKAKTQSPYFIPKNAIPINRVLGEKDILRDAINNTDYQTIGVFEHVDICENIKITFRTCCAILEKSPPTIKGIFYKILLFSGKLLWVHSSCLNKTLTYNFKLDQVPTKSKFPFQIKKTN